MGGGVGEQHSEVIRAGLDEIHISMPSFVLLAELFFCFIRQQSSPLSP